MVLLPYYILSPYCHADKSKSCHYPKNNLAILRNYVKENNMQAARRLYIGQYHQVTI